MDERVQKNRRNKAAKGAFLHGAIKHKTSAINNHLRYKMHMRSSRRFDWRPSFLDGVADGRAQENRQNKAGKGTFLHGAIKYNTSAINKHLRYKIARAARVDLVDALVLEVMRRVAAVKAPAAGRGALLYARAPRHAPCTTLPATTPVRLQSQAKVVKTRPLAAFFWSVYVFCTCTPVGQ